MSVARARAQPATPRPAPPWNARLWLLLVVWLVASLAWHFRDGLRAWIATLAP